MVTITFANSVASVNFLPTRISDSNALINVPHVINTRAAPLRPANPTVTPTLTSHDGTKAQHSLDNIHQLMKDHYFAVRRVFNKQDLTALDSQTGKITKILFSDRYYVLATASPDDKFRVILGRSKYDDKTVVPPVVAALPPSASAKASSFLVSMDYTTIGIGLFAVGGIYFLLSYRVHNSAASKKAKK